MPEKSGMDAAVCALTCPAAGTPICPKPGSSPPPRILSMKGNPAACAWLLARCPVPSSDARAPERASLRVPFGLLGDRPRPRQCVVLHRDLVIDDVLVCLVEKNPLL